MKWFFMSPEILIRARKVSKIYPPRGSPLRVMAGLLFGNAFTPGFEALHDVSFDLARGEALGIVGRNGAGKSTMLQIIAGTQMPTRGTVERRGRLAAMLALGAGFNPEFSGRENVYLSAAVYGLNDAQIEERFPSIAAFADIGDFMGRPVREYSSGMYARLAFSICAHVDADVLIVDEILGVGDSSFQAKCRRWIEQFLRRGALIYVSHDENSVLSVCDRAIWLDGGRRRDEGPTGRVLRNYNDAMTRDCDASPAAYEEPEAGPNDCDEVWSADTRLGTNPISVSRFLESAPAHGHGGARIHDVYFADTAEERLDEIQGGERVSLHIRGRALDDVDRPIVGFILRDALGQNLLGDNTFLTYRQQPRAMRAGDPFRAVLTFTIPFLPLGVYTIAPSIIDGTQQSHIQLYWQEEAIVLTVSRSPLVFGKIGVPMLVEPIMRVADETN
jgi:lipopolysaccharide transport system ATP-binding protein